MKYLLFCCTDHKLLGAMPQGEWNALVDDTYAYVDRLRASGLSIVRGFSEALGGRVNAGPRRDGNRGAEFVVSLPVATQAASALEPGA